MGTTECLKLGTALGCPKKSLLVSRLQALENMKADLCWLDGQACDMIFKDGSKVTSAGMCTGLSSATLEACKLFANTLDPLCEKEVPIFENMCKKSITTAGVFGTTECLKLGTALGCPKKSPLAWRLQALENVKADLCWLDGQACNMIFKDG